MLKTAVLTGLILFTAVLVAAQNAVDSEFMKLNSELAQYYSKGDFDKALVAAKRLVQIMEQDKGKDSLGVGVAIKNRGMVEQAKGDDKSAEKSFEEAVRVFKKHSESLSKPEGASFAELLENLGRLRADKALLQTEGIFKEALEWRERSNGPDAAQTATPLVYLANIKFWQRHYKSSAAMYSRALGNLVKSPTASKEDITLVYYRTQCTYRKAKIEDEFEALKKLYGSAAEFSPPVPTSSDGARQVRFIKAGVINGKALLLAKPPYPAEARGSRAQGTVEVEALINESGQVISACGKAEASHPALEEASELAAYKSKFSPTILDGKPVKVWGRITYNFRRF